MFKGGGSGALVVMEQVLQLDPRLMGGGVGFQDAEAEIVGNGLVDPLEDVWVDFLPSNIAGVGFRRRGGTVDMMEDLVSSKMKLE